MEGDYMDSLYVFTEDNPLPKNSCRLPRSSPEERQLLEQLIHRILQLCRARKISVTELARLSGVHPSTLKSIIYGRSQNPGIITIWHICCGLQLSLDEFFRKRYFPD
ncbi:MAG: helix-turn-helix domain-containing protein [Lachnospiraceae bacterium]|nr:helix-turn-helix domain-containing protein [Lachnospiraceae bacterium]